jgi:SNF family Na+-dependent transporter
LALNYLDRQQLKRSRNRLVVHGALLAAVTPPLFTAMRKISSNELLAWYLVTAFAALTALLPLSESSSAASMAGFRHIRASSAIVLAIFAIAHVFNHSLAIVSLGTHTAVLHVLRLVCRQNVAQTILIAAVGVQVCARDSRWSGSIPCGGPRRCATCNWFPAYTWRCFWCRT